MAKYKEMIEDKKTMLVHFDGMEVETDIKFNCLGLLARGGSSVVELWASKGNPKRKKAFKKFIYSDRKENKDAEVKNIEIEAKYLKEINIMKQLKHRNVIRLLGAVQTLEYCGLLLAYCEDGTLRDAISTLTRLSTRKYSLQIGRGLAYLHKKCVFHGDLKPTNVLIHRDTAVISDFGLSLRLPSHDATVDVTEGTPDFLAPETYHDQMVNPFKVDVYAFGITLWCMVTKRSPHYTTDFRGDLDSMTDLTCVPKGYRDLIKMLICKVPDKRPTIAEILTEM